jgi:uncharacterized Ntn-hydrolase superfamily protein
MHFKRTFPAIAFVLLLASEAWATWSILAIDTASGQMIVASATCLQQSVFPRIGVRDLRDVQAVVVPGKGIAVCQASIDTSRGNQQLIQAELGLSTNPARILELLKLRDPAVESRQFGILDLQGRSLGFSGKGNLANALSESGKASSEIFYQMQGNILANDDVIHEAARAFTRTSGTLADRVMAAMEAADSKGGDRRCTDGRTAYVAYILIVDKAGKETYITASDEDSSNPIRALRMRYDAQIRRK